MILNFKSLRMGKLRTRTDLMEEYEALRQDCCAEKPYQVGVRIDKEIIGGKIGMHGGSTYPSAALRFLLLHSPKGILLDLGSGSGETVIYGAHHSWDAYGIEICLNAYTFSLENIRRSEKEGYIEPGLARIVHGNFFPGDFQVVRHKRKEQDEFGERLEEHAKECPAENPYEQLVLQLNQADLFYHYQVERRNNILRLFSERAKTGARLLFAPSFSDSFQVPENLIGTAFLGHTYLYEKTA